MKSLSNQKSEAKPESVWLRIHPALGVSMMDYLFNKLDAMYPGMWRHNYPTEISVNNWRDTWAEAFEEDRVLPQQVKTGIQQCRKLYDRPPSITQFIKACGYVEPQAHRDFKPMLVHKMTKEEREANLKKLHESARKLFEKKSA